MMLNNSQNTTLMNLFNSPWVYLALVFCLFFAGCDNTIQPLDRENGVYSIYGALDLREDVNFVRVKDLNRTLLEDTSGTIDAIVVIEDLQSGDTDVMQDSIVSFEGVKTHNFYTAMDILPETRFRVSVERSDGRTVSAETITPSFAQTNVDPVMEDCLTRINVTFTPVQNRTSLSLRFGFNYEGQRWWVNPRANVLGNPSDFGSGGDSQTYSFTPKTIIDLYPPGEGDNPFDNDDGIELWCHQLDNGQFYIRYTHYSQDYFDTTTSDSLQIPKGTGRLISLYKDTLNFRIDTVNVCKPNC